jgi:hypothetical protein
MGSEYQENLSGRDAAPRRAQFSWLCAGDPGQEYLILQPSETAQPFTVMLGAGTYSVEWHSLATRATQAAGTLTRESGGSVSFTAPFAEAGPVVVYLKQIGR